MKKIFELFLEHIRLFVLMLYVLASFLVFHQRADILYRHISILRATPLGDLPLDLLLFFLLLLGLICLATLLYRPWLTANLVNNAFVEAKLKNGKGVSPTLLRVTRDKNKEHGKIFRVRNNGVSIKDFNGKWDKLETSLGGKIYDVTPGRRFTTDLYFLPQRYVRPSVLSPNDNAIGAISLQHLISLLIIGAPGTGKTVCSKILMFKILKISNTPTPNPTQARIWLLDFKQFDFRAFAGLPHYYSFTDCLQGLKDYYSAFKAQQEKGVAGEINYLFIDEWGSLVSSLERKEAEYAKHLLFELLSMGRAYRYIPIIGIQRPDASFFNGGRDNFQACLALGNLSPEGRRMAFPDSVKEQITECRQREGHLYIDGKGLEKIKIEDIADIDALDMSIREAMSR